MNIDKKEQEFSWFDDPGIVTNIIIALIAIIIILSQSFAVNSGLGTMDILKSIVNHNSIYLITLVYFVALKTYTGKKYFNFLNLFLIILYLITSITSLLTIFQSFSLIPLMKFALQVVLLIYLVHTLFRRTRVWKEYKLAKSPFNEIKNDSYFYTVVILSVIILSLNLIFTTSFDGTVLAILDCVYMVFFARYIFLYGVYLDQKEKKTDTKTDFNELKDKALNVMDEVVSKTEEVVSEIKEKTEDVTNELKEKIEDVVDDIKEEKEKNTKKTTKKNTKKKGDK